MLVRIVSSSCASCPKPIALKIHLLTGPNLNLVGRREPEIYGSTSHEDYLAELRQALGEKCDISYFQSNSEGELIDRLHAIGYGEGADANDGVVVNFGGLSHTSIALADALRGIPQRVIEVHISNIYTREDFRQNSFTAAACVGVVTGLGLEGYRLACEWFLRGR